MARRDFGHVIYCGSFSKSLAPALQQDSFGPVAQFAEPAGGIFIWVTLPGHVDTTRLAAVALQQGVALLAKICGEEFNLSVTHTS